MAKEKIIVGILIFVLGSLILYILIGSGNARGILNQPNPILIAPSDNYNEACPGSLYFNSEGTSSFKITIRNSGAEGGLFTQISSKNILVKSSKITDVFGNQSTIRWNIISGSSQDFDFKLQKNLTNLENISISVTYGCDGICLSHTFCCNYNASDKWFNDNPYKFIGQTNYC